MLIISDNKTYIIKEGESIPEEIPENIIPFIVATIKNGWCVDQIPVSKNIKSHKDTFNNYMWYKENVLIKRGEL